MAYPHFCVIRTFDLDSVPFLVWAHLPHALEAQIPVDGRTDDEFGQPEGTSFMSSSLRRELNA